MGSQSLVLSDSFARPTVCLHGHALLTGKSRIGFNSSHGYSDARRARPHDLSVRRERYRSGRRTLVLNMTASADQPLRILHALRSPVSGTFRHIMDLANGQAERGHDVGIFADSLTGGERADAALKDIAPRLKLGVHRFAIPRHPSPTDILTWVHFVRLIRTLKPDVLHGHGARVGVFLRVKPIQKTPFTPIRRTEARCISR